MNGTIPPPQTDTHDCHRLAVTQSRAAEPSDRWLCLESTPGNRAEQHSGHSLLLVLPGALAGKRRESETSLVGQGRTTLSTQTPHLLLQGDILPCFSNPFTIVRIVVGFDPLGHSFVQVSFPHTLDPQVLETGKGTGKAQVRRWEREAQAFLKRRNKRRGWKGQGGCKEDVRRKMAEEKRHENQPPHKYLPGRFSLIQGIWLTFLLTHFFLLLTAVYIRCSLPPFYLHNDCEECGQVIPRVCG